MTVQSNTLLCCLMLVLGYIKLKQCILYCERRVPLSVWFKTKKRRHCTFCVEGLGHAQWLGLCVGKRELRQGFLWVFLFCLFVSRTSEMSQGKSQRLLEGGDEAAEAGWVSAALEPGFAAWG